MTRPSRKTIEPLLDEFARLKARCISIELQRDKELAPLRAAFEKKAGPIVADAQAKLGPIQKRLAVLAGDIDAQMMDGVDQKKETIALSEVSVDIETTRAVAAAVAKANDVEFDDLDTNDSGRPILRAVATVETKPGDRIIDPEKFYNAVKASERNGGFWSCFKVLMGAADKFMGKEKVSKLATNPKSFYVSVNLKP